MDLIFKYFPYISDKTVQLLSSLYNIYQEWNKKINLISRKDLVYFNERHVLHSLSIAYIFKFEPDTLILDVGTGGGFPGIPLAIFFPNVNFYLVDSITKKCNVVKAVVNELNLTNVKVVNKRVEEVNEKFDFIVSRAVAPMQTLWKLVNKNISPSYRNNVPNGLICLKGGDLHYEVTSIGRSYQIYELCDFFKEDFFVSKKLVHVW